MKEGRKEGRKEHLLRTVFFRTLRFFPLLKNPEFFQTPKISIQNQDKNNHSVDEPPLNCHYLFISDIFIITWKGPEGKKMLLKERLSLRANIFLKLPF